MEITNLYQQKLDKVTLESKQWETKFDTLLLTTQNNSVNEAELP